MITVSDAGFHCGTCQYFSVALIQATLLMTPLQGLLRIEAGRSVSDRMHFLRSFRLIPQIFFIVVHFIFIQHRFVFLLKALVLMMLFLLINIGF